MKKKINKRQETRILMYFSYLLIMGILVLLGVRSIPLGMVLFILTEIITLKYLSWRRSRYKERTIESIDSMNKEEFEEFVEMQFKFNGFKTSLINTSIKKESAIFLKRKNEEIIIFTVKSSNKIDELTIKSIIEEASLLNTKDIIIVTNNYFTENAVNLANKYNFNLLNRENLKNIATNDIEEKV